jgi:hypothetical protein
MHDLIESRQAAIRLAQSPLVTQTTAASLAHLTRRQIAELVRDGQLASLQVGRLRYVLRWSLDDLLRALDGRAA